MDTRVLRYFVAVVEWGSLTEGASSLGVSQPTVSRQLRGLEAELGTQLFERGHGALRLTHAGRRFHGMAIDMVRREDSAKDAIGHERTPADQRLLVLAPLATIYSALGPFLASEGADLPIVDAMETEPLVVFDRVNRMGADLGISTVPPPPHWSAFHIGTLPVRAHVSPGSPLARLEHIELEELVRYPLLLMDRTNSARIEFDRAVAEASLHVDAVELTSSSMLQGVAAGRGMIAILSAAPAHGLVPIPIRSAGTPLHLSTYAGWDATHYASDVILGFVQGFQEWSLSDGGPLTGVYRTHPLRTPTERGVPPA